MDRDSRRSASPSPEEDRSNASSEFERVIDQYESRVYQEHQEKREMMDKMISLFEIINDQQRVDVRTFVYAVNKSFRDEVDAAELARSLSHHVEKNASRSLLNQAKKQVVSRRIGFRRRGPEVDAPTMSSFQHRVQQQMDDIMSSSLVKRDEMQERTHYIPEMSLRNAFVAFIPTDDSAKYPFSDPSGRCGYEGLVVSLKAPGIRQHLSRHVREARWMYYKYRREAEDKGFSSSGAAERPSMNTCADKVLDNPPYFKEYAKSMFTKDSLQELSALELRQRGVTMATMADQGVTYSNWVEHGKTLADLQFLGETTTAVSEKFGFSRRKAIRKMKTLHTEGIADVRMLNRLLINSSIVLLACNENPHAICEKGFTIQDLIVLGFDPARYFSRNPKYLKKWYNSGLIHEGWTPRHGKDLLMLSESEFYTILQQEKIEQDANEYEHSRKESLREGARDDDDLVQPRRVTEREDGSRASSVSRRTPSSSLRRKNKERKTKRTKYPRVASGDESSESV